MRFRAFCLAIVFAAISLGGCSLVPGLDAASSAARDAAAKAAGDTLDAAEFVICIGGPVGPVLERYMTSEDLWSAWTTLCLAPPAALEAAVNAPR